MSLMSLLKVMLINLIIKMNKKSYAPCVGRKYRIIPKLYRPFCILLGSNICDEHMLSKNKVRFLSQIIRWFYKSRLGYKAKFFNINTKLPLILDGDVILLSGRTQKAAFKNLLAKLNYKLMDYKILKRRQYVLNFMFLFLNINEKLNNSIYLDILCSHDDSFKIYFILNGYYINDFYNILYYYNNFIYNLYYDYKLLKEVNFNDFNKFYNLTNLVSYELSFNVNDF